MSFGGAGLQVGFIEPHLRRYGGIRRVVEFANRLVARGHSVTFYLPEGQVLGCEWMRCDAAVKTLDAGYGDDLDVVVFNHEPHWYLLERFERARRRVFYALHFGELYQKEGSWEALWAPVDLQLANSAWTADQIASVTGSRPTVVLGGVNREVFQPWGGPKKYPLLTMGGSKFWKGTDTVEAAAASLGIPLEAYADKDLSQPALGREYDASEIFAVGSWFEGFCQPGLEAMACGVPLVTTDNGGCREYAIDGETALVVPPRNAAAMAAAISRLRDEPMLAKQLAANGLDVVAEHFDWEARTDELVAILDGVVAGSGVAPPPPRPVPPEEPELSIVVLAWDNLLYTQRFAQTVRQHTDVDYELIIVDNGSAADAADYAKAAADTVVANPTNFGFAKGMNQGLAAARGTWVAFCNNDTLLPANWASQLLETANAHPRAGIVVPAITAAKNPVTVRDAPGETVEIITPFSAPPAAVIYLMRADLVRALGAWDEGYEVASGEDVDLAFTVWANDLDIVYDTRVLVDHVGKGTATRLDDWEGLWARNRRRFLDKWTGAESIVRIDSCDPDRHERNRATARGVAGWMERYFSTRDRHDETRKQLAARSAEKQAAATEMSAWPSRAKSVAGDRDTSRAGAWLRELDVPTADSPILARAADGTVYLIEGGKRRRVRSGLLAAALEPETGEPCDVTNEALQQWPEGVPVEPMREGVSAPFVVVGRRRLPLRGLPDFHPADPADLSQFHVGPALDVAAANVPRSRLNRASSPTTDGSRMRSDIHRREISGAGRSTARRMGAKARRFFRSDKGLP